MRDGDGKLLAGKDTKPLELFRFPQDRWEKTNVGEQDPAEVKRLQSLLAAWTATLPRQPDPQCFSKTR